MSGSTGGHSDRALAAAVEAVEHVVTQSEASTLIRVYLATLDPVEIHNTIPAAARSVTTWATCLDVLKAACPPPPSNASSGDAS